MDLVPRRLSGQQEMTTATELDAMAKPYPYCSLISVDRVNNDASASWRVPNSPIPPISYHNFTSRVDARFFNRYRRSR